MAETLEKLKNGMTSIETIVISVASIILASTMIWIGATMIEIKVATASMNSKLDYVVVNTQENRNRIERLERQ